MCVEGRGGREVMLPWRVPCSPDEGFLKKRGMPARCTSVGVMLGVLLRLARVLLLHHHLLAQVHFPTYLALPSLPLGLARPVSAGQPSVAAGRLLFVDTATPVHQMVGRWICVCVSVCVCARSLSCMHAPADVGTHCTRLHTQTYTQRSMSMLGRDAGLRTLSSTQETPALGRVNGQCTTTGSVIFIE